MLRVGTLLLSLCLIAQGEASVPKATRGYRPLATRSGKLSIVHLLEVRRINAQGAAEHGAPGGVQLTFLVVRQPQVEGQLTLSELRDIEIDGSKYSVTTASALDGRKFEPQTTIDNPPNARIAAGAVGALVPLDGKTAVVVRTELFGQPLPGEGQMTVRFEVGWGKRTEALVFSRALDQLL